MKKILLLFSFSILVTFQVSSQCNPDFTYTSLGFPGVYPPEIPIPNLPIPLGIADGSIGSNYNQTLTLVVLEDTTLDVAFLLPAAAVTAMNLAGISTVMTVDVNHVSFNVQGLPNGINYQCDILSCQYPSAVDGCIQLSGIPTVSGTFSVPVNMNINIQIPSIAGIIPSMAVDIPEFPAQTYDLFISSTTSINDFKEVINIYPNPTNSKFNIDMNFPKIISVSNNIGQIVYESNIPVTHLTLDKNELGKGIFIIHVSDDFSFEKHKLIIN